MKEYLDTLPEGSADLFSVYLHAIRKSNPGCVQLLHEYAKKGVFDASKNDLEAYKLAQTTYDAVNGDTDDGTGDDVGKKQARAVLKAVKTFLQIDSGDDDDNNNNDAGKTDDTKSSGPLFDYGDRAGGSSAEKSRSRSPSPRGGGRVAASSAKSKKSKNKAKKTTSQRSKTSASEDSGSGSGTDSGSATESGSGSGTESGSDSDSGSGSDSGSSASIPDVSHGGRRTKAPSSRGHKPSGTKPKTKKPQHTTRSKPLQRAGSKPKPGRPASKPRVASRGRGVAASAYDSKPRSKKPVVARSRSRTPVPSYSARGPRPNGGTKPRAHADGHATTRGPARSRSRSKTDAWVEHCKKTYKSMKTAAKRDSSLPAPTFGDAMIAASEARRHKKESRK